MPPPDDEALIGRAQLGDVASFEELVRRHDRSVLRLALSLLGSEEEARDVYQEAFLRAYRSLAGFRQESTFETWMFRIVTNLCLDRLRRQAGRAEVPAGTGAAAAEAAGAGVAGEMEDRLARVADDRPDHDPEKALLQREIRRQIEAAIAGLSSRERLVFELRHYQGLRLKTIGEILETSEETARNCLFRAHRQLRARLRDFRGAVRDAGRERAGPLRVEKR